MITNKKIGVLMGGISSERDISLKTGNLITASLKRTGYDVAAIDAGSDLPWQIDKNGVEVAFIALHGRYGEDGCVQGLLELMGIPYTGSGVAASAICMDKVISKRLFKFYSIPTPEFILYRKDEDKRPAVSDYPVVVKPCREGSTIGVSIVTNKEALSPAIENAFHYGDDVIIEKYIDGTEVTAGILDDTPLPLIEIVPKEGFYDYKTKTTSGAAEYIAPARLPSPAAENIKSIALRTHRAMGCCYVSRIDFRVDHAGNPYVLEVNTVPGMTETSLLPRAAGEAGIGYDELVEMILTSAFCKKRL